MRLPEMANTYTQIYLHVVFAVSGRACVIVPARREDLQKYIVGIVTRKGQKLITIYCLLDHTHLLLGLKPNIAPSDLIGDIKTGSSNHINQQKKVVSRRIPRISGAPPCSVRSALHFPVGRMSRDRSNMPLIRSLVG